jgi:hypothetical protein
MLRNKESTFLFCWRDFLMAEASVSLKILMETHFDWNEPLKYVHDYRAEIIINGDDFPSAEKVGHISGSYIAVDLWETNPVGSLFDVFDSHSQSLSDLYPIIMDDRQELKANIIEEISYHNILFIEDAGFEDAKDENHPEWLAKAIAYFIRTLGREVDAVIYESVLNSKHQKINDIFKGLGFKRIPDSHYLFFNRHQALTLPNEQQF